MDSLEAAREDTYDPQTHPILVEFKEQVLNSQEEEELCAVPGAEQDEESDVVMGQVDKGLKCPLTMVFYNNPVTSKMCKHSYSQEAIVAHIKRRQVVKCSLHIIIYGGFQRWFPVTERATWTIWLELD